MLVWTEILTRLFLASLFGALIGLERERKDWTAGMRTHMMVCLGSSLIMMVSAFGFSDVLGTAHIVLDPARIAAQVISGIGFIGAGTILFLKQGTIRGITTASGLWTVAAIGLATGGGMYFAAAAATLLSLIILWALQPFEKKISQRFNGIH
jgi:putative Mg2+ transporter-C (MgtC) family protein